MPEEPWNKHTPGDPIPYKCGESLVEVINCNGELSDSLAGRWEWGKVGRYPYDETFHWRFTERKGEDVIAADPYPTLEWDEDDTTTVVLKKPGRPWWVRDGDLVRFTATGEFRKSEWFGSSWNNHFAFQIKRRPALTPADPQLLAMLAVASDDEADAIRSAARRANIEVPE